MFLFTLEITEYGITFYENIWADNTADAIACGYEMFPDADWIDVC